MAGTARGVLDGIPIAHKDIYGIAGIRTTAHSKQLIDYVPDADAFTVTKLAAAGTMMLGKLSSHEFALGGPSFDLPWPPARNPWNTDHFPAGSSSGTGGAVAAGLILGDTGSDTGGSIRGPSALCGIAGIKPTYGLCSRAGIQPLSFTLDHAGPMAWTVEDCAILLQAMAGHDPASADCAVPDTPPIWPKAWRACASAWCGISTRQTMQTIKSLQPCNGASMTRFPSGPLRVRKSSM